MQHRTIFCAFLCTTLSLPIAVQAQAQPYYRLVDVGTLGGAESHAYALNELGEVAGWAETNSGDRHAFVFSEGRLYDLGTLPGGSSSVAYDLNSAGVVVGSSGINEFGAGFAEHLQAFFWSDGEMNSLGALYCPCDFNNRYGDSSAYGVNYDGLIVGDSETVRGSWIRHAFLYQAPNLIDLGGGAGSWAISRALDVANNGVVAGEITAVEGPFSTTDTPAIVAFLWLNEDHQRLGSLPGDMSSSARAVNEHGQAAGWSGDTEGSARIAVLFDRGGLSPLGTLEGDIHSTANSINNLAQVVGWSANVDESRRSAFFWEEGIMYDLNEITEAPANWFLVEATDINNRGEITGIARVADRDRAFLLVPSND